MLAGIPPAGDAGAQRGFQPHGVLAAGPPVTGEQPGVVVEEGEQDRLAAIDGRAVQRVAGPPLVRRVGLEPPERSAVVARPARVVSSSRTKLRCSVRSSGDQPECARRIAAICAAVRSGTSFFNATASSSTSAGVRGDDLARCRHQGVEPAAAPVPDPPVDRGPRHPHRLPERAVVLPLGQRRTSRPRCLVDSSRRRPPGSGSTETARRCGPARPAPVLRHGRTPSTSSFDSVQCTRVARLVDHTAVPKGQLVLIDSARQGRAQADSRS